MKNCLFNGKTTLVISTINFGTTKELHIVSGVFIVTHECLSACIVENTERPCAINKHDKATKSCHVIPSCSFGMQEHEYYFTKQLALIYKNIAKSFL